jgi:hypothetical protein
LILGNGEGDGAPAIITEDEPIEEPAGENDSQ